MIRQNKVHAICCTGANLEEDVYNLVAHDHYEQIPNYRHLSAADEVAIKERGLARVTDTCIPEEEAMRKIEHHLVKLWQHAEQNNLSYFPHEYLYQLLNSGELVSEYQIDPKDSWLIAAAEKNLPIFVPGWEDSTTGNYLVASKRKGQISDLSVVKSGVEYMDNLIDWYRETSKQKAPGFFQIGGGIAGDFPICVVPLLRLDLKEEVPYWSYFCQISDSTTSYGSYSGAVPNEKITWDKIDETTPQFVIESDATIVAPLIFAY
ncbi:UNVERIFIED_CONTAM: hypothetical protein GTU68_025149, partial [Idotea baltica]|nr:hypothetical protein [Idotea baltica]